MLSHATSRRPRLLQRAAAALTYPLPPGDYLGALRPRAAGRARVEAVEAAALDAVTLTIRPPRGFPRHRPGQFVRLGVDIDGVRHWRCYSISSPPERADGCFTITVKAIADGCVSNHLVDNLSPGTHVGLEPPAGEFVLPDVLPESLLFVTAGSGITPVMSMLASLELRAAMPAATLIHCARSRDEMIFADALVQLAARHPQLRLHLVHTREHGRLTPARLQQLCPEWRGCDTWACGPDGLLETLEAQWQGAGAGARLHVERFRPRRSAGRGAGQTGRVQFLRSACAASGRSDEPLLELAERSGLAPAHGCRMGICHSCTATLKGGRVRDLRDGREHAEDGDLVQICVCAPVGDVQIDL